MKNNFFFNKKLTNIYEGPSRELPISSQILYGEKFKVLSKNKNWLRINLQIFMRDLLKNL